MLQASDIFQWDAAATIFRKALQVSSNCVAPVWHTLKFNKNPGFKGAAAAAAGVWVNKYLLWL